MAVRPEEDEFFDGLEMMPPGKRPSYQDRELSRALVYAYLQAPAVKRIFEKAGITPAEIKTVKDLEKLPVTRKTDLIEMQKAEPPYGGLVTIPPEDIERIFISPGPIYEIQPSAIMWFVKSFWAAGFRHGDVVINTFTYHMSPAGMLFHEGLRDCGATVVVAGTGNTDQQIQIMKDLRVNGFVGTPSFLMTILKRAGEMGLKIKKDLPLERAWFTGEMLAPSLRKAFEGDYHIDTYQAYAVTEPGGCVAYECRQKSGMHLMDEFITEIIDPATGRQLGPGETGEIVVTPVHNSTWGLVRFGTGDLSSYITESCPCGRTANRLTGIIGRTGEAVKVRGMFVVAKQADQAIMSIGGISRYQLIVGRRQNRDELVLKAELTHEGENTARLAAELEKKFQDVCRVKIDRIDFVQPGTISEKEPGIKDERKWE
jgi:phenylacetate-CoA ligase